MSERFPRPKRIEVVGDDGMAIRQLVSDDAQRYFDLIEYNRAHLSKFGDVTSLNYPDVESVMKSIVSPDDPSRLRFGMWVGDTMVGSINLTPRGGKTAEVGYWVGAEHVGHGYAPKATDVLIRYAFSRADFDLLFAVVNIGNKDSIKTLERSGFKDPKLSLDGDSLRYELAKSDSQPSEPLM